MTISKRDFPYPFKGMATVSIDTDFGRLEGDAHKYVRTTSGNLFDEYRTIGSGLGLDIWSDSFWLSGVEFQGWDGFTLFDSVTGARMPAADTIELGIMAGYIDATHGLGSYHTQMGAGSSSSQYTVPLTSSVRSAIASWINEPYEWGKRTSSWYDHNPSSTQWNRVNFGFGTNNQRSGFGSDPNGEHYHTDITVGLGACRFAWDGQYSDAIYQWDIDTIGYSPQQVAMNTYTGSTTVGAGNLLTPRVGMDGTKWWGFPRWYVPSEFLGATFYYDEIWFRDGSPRLSNIEDNGGYFIHYTHGTPWYPGGSPVGYEPDPYKSGYYEPSYLPKMKEWYDNGVILPSRIGRLLGYALAHEHAVIEEPFFSIPVGKTVINITHIEDECFGDFVPSFSDLRGLTFYIDDGDATDYVLAINGKIVSETGTQRNPADISGKQSIGFVWWDYDATKDYYSLGIEQAISDFGVSVDIGDEYLSQITVISTIEFDLSEEFLMGTQEAAGSISAATNIVGAVTEREAVAGFITANANMVATVTAKAVAAGYLNASANVVGSTELPEMELFDLAEAFIADIDEAAGSFAAVTNVYGEVDYIPIPLVSGSVGAAANVYGAAVIDSQDVAGSVHADANVVFEYAAGWKTKDKTGSGWSGSRGRKTGWTTATQAEAQWND